MGEHDTAVAAFGDEPVVGLIGVDLEDAVEAVQLLEWVLMASPLGVRHRQWRAAHRRAKAARPVRIPIGVRF